MRLGELGERLLAAVFPRRCVLCGRAVAWEEDWCGKCPLAREEGEKLPGQAASPFAYRDGVRRAVLLLKRRPDRRTAAFFARHMADCARRTWPEAEFSWVVPVPVSLEGLERRGYNQAALLAELVGKELGTVLREDLLERGESPAQHTLDREGRRRNAAASYRAAGKVRGTVLLVDDVYTTGATLEACSLQLREAGACAVMALAAAYTHSR